MILTFMVHSIAVASITTLETELAAGDSKESLKT